MFGLDFGHLLEEVLEAPWQETPSLLTMGRPLYRVGLSRPCLTICENRAVIAHHALIYDVSANSDENLLLLCLLLCHIVKGERLIGHQLDCLVSALLQLDTSLHCMIYLSLLFGL